MLNRHPEPTLESAPSGGSRAGPFAASVVDLEPLGYVEKEYFLSGAARAWAPRDGTKTGQDGQWSSEPTGTSQRYKTRLLARMPSADRFNGVLIVEWMQEMFGTERDIFFRWNAETILRSGFAWAGVSLHHESVDGPGPNSLKNWDSERYDTLAIPASGDLGYDILTQAGLCLRKSDGPLQGLNVTTMLAAGNSLSAWRLSTYVNAVQPVEDLFDGFYLQDFRQKTVQDRVDRHFPHDRYIRADSATPVMMLNMTPAALRSTGQPPGRLLRRWEPAGASHTNTFLMARTALAEARDTGQIIHFCPEDYANNIPSQYFSGAALESLTRWVEVGSAPPDFAPIDLAPGGREPALDEHGNVLGGLRHPWIDVPLGRYHWEGKCVGGSGRTCLFMANRLDRLYGDPKGYHLRFATAARSAAEQGIINSADAEAAILKAANTRW